MFEGVCISVCGREIPLERERSGEGERGRESWGGGGGGYQKGWFAH